MQAIILAGGLGTRLRPVTINIPKCMVPINGKPFLLYLLNLLKIHGIENVLLCIGYLGEQIEIYFGDGSKLGLNINYSRENKELLGTGGALKLAEGLMENTFWVINGDTYLDIDYQKIWRIFADSYKKSLIVAYPCDSRERGDLAIDTKFNVTRYEKSNNDNLGYVNAGALILQKEVVSWIETGRHVSLEKEIFPLVIQRNAMAAYITPTSFFDIGTFSTWKGFSKYIQEYR